MAMGSDLKEGPEVVRKIVSREAVSEGEREAGRMRGIVVKIWVGFGYCCLWYGLRWEMCCVGLYVFDGRREGTRGLWRLAR